MKTINRGGPEVWDTRKQAFLTALRQTKGLDFTLEGRRGSRVARGPAGTIHILGSLEARPGRWWLGLDERAFLERDDTRGVVLLCETGTSTLDFWLPAVRVRELLPRMSSSGGERKFNVVQRGERFSLKLPGAQAIDITATRGDTSWLTRTSSADGQKPSDRQPTEAVPDPGEVTFFARVRRGRLEPLDQNPLVEGAVVIVRASAAKAVPRQAALRRIIASGGPGALPADFAEQHDHYTRGAAKR